MNSTHTDRPALPFGDAIFADPVAIGLTPTKLHALGAIDYLSRQGAHGPGYVERLAACIPGERGKTLCPGYAADLLLEFHRAGLVVREEDDRGRIVGARLAGHEHPAPEPHPDEAEHVRALQAENAALRAELAAAREDTALGLAALREEVALLRGGFQQLLLGTVPPNLGTRPTPTPSPRLCPTPPPEPLGLSLPAAEIGSRESHQSTLETAVVAAVVEGATAPAAAAPSLSSLSKRPDILLAADALMTCVHWHASQDATVQRLARAAHQKPGVAWDSSIDIMLSRWAKEVQAAKTGQDSLAILARWVRQERTPEPPKTPTPKPATVPVRAASMPHVAPKRLAPTTDTEAPPEIPAEARATIAALRQRSPVSEAPRIARGGRIPAQVWDELAAKEAGR